jgi:hypothetical protein
MKLILLRQLNSFNIFDATFSMKYIQIIAESLSQHDKKHVVPTSLIGIRVRKRRRRHTREFMAPFDIIVNAISNVP